MRRARMRPRTLSWHYPATIPPFPRIPQRVSGKSPVRHRAATLCRRQGQQPRRHERTAFEALEPQLAVGADHRSRHVERRSVLVHVLRPDRATVDVRVDAIEVGRLDRDRDRLPGLRDLGLQAPDDPSAMRLTAASMRSWLSCRRSSAVIAWTSSPEPSRRRPRGVRPRARRRASCGARPRGRSPPAAASSTASHGPGSTGGGGRGSRRSRRPRRCAPRRRRSGRSRGPGSRRRRCPSRCSSAHR